MKKTRLLTKIGKEFDELVADMKKTAGAWSTATGSNKNALLRSLKSMTAQKQKLQAEMEQLIMDIDKDVELKIDAGNVDEQTIIRHYIAKLIEQEIKSIIPNRSTRRLAERNIAKSASVVHRRSMEFVKKLKTVMTEGEWNNLQNFLLPISGVTEAAAISDDVVAKSIAQLAKEMSSGKLTIDPNDINVDALDDPTSDASDIVKESRIKLNESGLGLLLTAPSVLKLVANVSDWVGSFLVKGGPLSKENKDGRQMTSMISKIYKMTKKNKTASGKSYKIPSKDEIITKYKLQGEELKVLDMAFKRIAKFVKEDTKKTASKTNNDSTSNTNFNLSGNKPLIVNDHTLHVIYSSSFDTDIGKGLAKFAHTLHELFLIPFRLVVAGALWIGSNAKEKIKKGWNWIKSKMGMDSEEVDSGYTFKKAYDASKKIANALYTVCMLYYAITEIASHGLNFAEAWDQIKSILSSGVDNSSKVLKIASAIKSNVESVYVTVLDGIKAGDLLAEITELISTLFTAAVEVSS